jgi:two-component system, sensor histidine kinase
MERRPRMPDGSTAPPRRILLAEERAAVRDVLEVAPARLRSRIESVVSGGSALASARRDPADLIVLSTTLPDMPGARLIGALRELPEVGQAPILAIYEGGAEVRDACMAAGATECLGRPLETERLLGLIERLVEGGVRPEAPIPKPVLDLDHLRQFTDGDPQLEGELAALFLSTAEIYLHDMHEALEEGRPWSAIAHALKGASANLGARRVAALALTAERAEPTRTQLEAIESAIGEVRALLERGAAVAERRADHQEAEGSPQEIP